ncbi:MAG: transposase [Eubacterium sp.]
MDFEAYNESTVLLDAVERYKKRTGHYPERILVDQIYRSRDNHKACKSRGFRLSGPRLGGPSKKQDADKKIEVQDNVDRIEVERAFSLGKRCYGLDLIKTK